MKLTNEQQFAFNKFCRGENICITGPAGCGKSYLIKTIVDHCNREKMEVAVTAMTGAAATLVKGQTLHRWGGLGLAKEDSSKIAANIIRYKPPVRKRWATTAVLIVDEVSMMSAELFNKVNAVAQRLRNSPLFFGGIQTVFCGDFAQLEPIKADRLCFESNDWVENLSGANTIYMKEVLRQQDPVFLKLLSEVRLGYVSPMTKKILTERMISDQDVGLTEIQIEGCTEMIKPTILFPHKKDVERINLQELNALTERGAKTHSYTSVDTIVNRKSGDSRSLSTSESDNINKTCNALNQIELAVGAQVMLITNLDFEKGLVNGSRGVVTKLEELPTVVFDDGQELVIERKSFDVELNKNEFISRLQIPLILAWAITIHKCQGATLTNVITDLSKVFCNAQTYVTLSRVRSLDGLFLSGINFKAIKCNPKVREYYRKLEEAK